MPTKSKEPKIRKERIPKIARKFNGKKYLRLSMHRNKTLAKERASQLRKLGYSTRVVKATYPWGYSIYGKKKSRFEP